MTRFVLQSLLVAALPAGEMEAVRSFNQFAAASYQEAAKGRDNLILSPISIATALSMAMAGARGDTKTEMASVLKQTMPVGWDDAVAALTESLAKAGNTAGNELMQANRLWVQRGFPIQSAFRTTMETSYRAPMNELDFLRNPETARTSINSWTSQQTKGKISELFAPGSLDGQSRLVLTTAIYFNGKWQSAFRAQDTHPGPFRSGEGGSTQGSFMNQRGSFDYAEIPGAQVLEMKYAGGQFAFDVFLPRKDNGLPELERSMTTANVAKWVHDIQPATVTVSLPKFRTDSEFSLRKTLSEIGMNKAFDPQSADFSGIDDRRDLFIADVVHKAFVNVSEEGTEAAAATGAHMMVASLRIEKPVVFRADHPFAFVIRDRTSGVILFEGRLARP